MNTGLAVAASIVNLAGFTLILVASIMMHVKLEQSELVRRELLLRVRLIEAGAVLMVISVFMAGFAAPTAGE